MSSDGNALDLPFGALVALLVLKDELDDERLLKDLRRRHGNKMFGKRPEENPNTIRK